MFSPLTALVAFVVVTAVAQALECVHPPYKVFKVSSSPLIVYLQDFLTPEERAHLKETSESRFRGSVVAGESGAERSGVRTSQSTDVDRDAIVQCIEQRALDFQGFDAHASQLEPLQLVKYGPGEQYSFHTDWLMDPQYSTSFNGGNRLTSFFVYVYVSNDTTGGGTNFPHVTPPRDKRWCGLIECDEPYANGVTFRPVEGNAVFWENLTPAGMGDPRTEHAGLPVTSGEKIGMNIWTRQVPLSEDVRRQDLPLDF